MEIKEETTKLSKQPSPVSVRLSPELKTATREAARREGIKLNAFIVEAIREKMGRVKNTDSNILLALESIEENTAKVRVRTTSLNTETNQLREQLKELESAIVSHSMTKKEIWETVSELSKHRPKVNEAYKRLITSLNGLEDKHKHQSANLIHSMDESDETIKRASESIEKYANTANDHIKSICHLFEHSNEYLERLSRNAKAATYSLNELDLENIPHYLENERERFISETYRASMRYFGTAFGVLVLCAGIFYGISRISVSKEDFIQACFDGTYHAIQATKKKGNE